MPTSRKAQNRPKGRFSVKGALSLVTAVGLLLALALAVTRITPSTVAPSNLAPTNVGGFLFVYQELAGEETAFWAADPQKPQNKRALLTVQHREGYGPRAGLSPKGTHLAYTILPTSARDAPSTAELWVGELTTGKTQLLQTGVELRSTPLWSPDGGTILFVRLYERSSYTLETELATVPLKGGEAHSLIRDATSQGLYPIGWSPDGRRAYFSRVTPQGTDVASVTTSGEVATVLHASDGIAREFLLSPDGSRVLYTSGPPPGKAGRYRVESADLATGRKETLAEGVSDHFSPIWRADGRAVTLSQEGGVASIEPGGVSALIAPAPGDSDDLPLAWSPEGRFLAVRSLEKAQGRYVSERLAIASPSGGRTNVETNGHAEFVGWLRGNSAP